MPETIFPTVPDNVLQYELEKVSQRYDGLRQDIFDEMGRLMYALEHYTMNSSTEVSYMARVRLLTELLQKDDARA